ncbi:uncharacterized protein MYCGRDRAFT_89550 [Zymoseptoria tritici IPO323]|uniref:Uncharacterized protein n=1 Tax=Zymoseptoria tritici (strain CBS 115943 / IPO323) TaxID=336722 RepID=F9WY33_ZYMTI|nr:uncharacterized protein MYCGRDRAFT_89550 [Zymoseptoria tritici IPO323]EGP92261.1 hypothetical protein MYCGRDRAFT_89550 [Zymoseptoria tritici IPO323]
MASRLRRLDGAWLRKLCRWLGIRKLTADNDDCPQGAVYAVETMIQVGAACRAAPSRSARWSMKPSSSLRDTQHAPDQVEHWLRVRPTIHGRVVFGQPEVEEEQESRRRARHAVHKVQGTAPAAARVAGRPHTGRISNATNDSSWRSGPACRRFG